MMAAKITLHNIVCVCGVGLCESEDAEQSHLFS